MPKTRIYIVEIEIENFESHEHTFLRDFSPGFNCIAGLSDVGKSSVIRAVKLCAYNQFDQKMVRTGASFCRVKITTNIGSVEVRKGPDVNLWIIKRN
ncbi:MAG: AAA family ATPase, partial [Candidatus Omnitrophica bacterium]|nr:AAA family ATPase [Candidatus Omnitrophota bacterium]